MLVIDPHSLITNPGAVWIMKEKGPELLNAIYLSPETYHKNLGNSFFVELLEEGNVNRYYLESLVAIYVPTGRAWVFVNGEFRSECSGRIY